MEKEFKISEAFLNKKKKHIWLATLAMTIFGLFIIAVILTGPASLTPGLSMLGVIFVAVSLIFFLIVFYVIPVHFSLKKMGETRLVITPGQLIRKTGDDEEKISFDEVEKLTVVYGDSEEPSEVKLYSKSGNLYLQVYENTEKIVDELSQNMAKEKIKIKDKSLFSTSTIWQAIVLVSIFLFFFLQYIGVPADSLSWIAPALVSFLFGVKSLASSFNRSLDEWHWVKGKTDRTVDFIWGVVLLALSIVLVAPFFIAHIGTPEVKWSYKTWGSVSSSPAVTNGVVYVGSDDNHLYAVEVDSGQELWSYATGSRVRSSPAVADGVVYVGSNDNHLYAIEADSGRELWSHETGGRVHSSPAVAEGVVYVGSWDNHLYAVEAESGRELWSYETGGPVHSSPAVADGVVYVGSDNLRLYAVEVENGRKLWSFRTGLQVQSSPAIADGVVYVGNNDNHLYAIEAESGRELWSYETGDDVRSSPAVVDGVVYVGSDDNHLYAIPSGD